VADHHEPTDDTMDEAALAVVARHALHDEELIAAFATGTTDSEADATRAQAFVERCAACRDLRADLVSIQAGVRSDARGSIAAPRDFRLSVADARRLGGTLSARGFLARLRRSMASVGRPVGASLAALGIVGVLVGTMDFRSATGGAAPASIDSGRTGSAASEAPAGPDATIVFTAGNRSAAPPKASELAEFGPSASTFDALGAGEGEGPGRDVVGPLGSPKVVLITGSVVAIVIGLALLLLTLRRPRERVIPPEMP
jgi:hypothetical protein